MSGNMDSTNANERLIIEISELLHTEFEKNSDRAVYFTLNGYINNIKSDEKWIYNAWPEENWGRKLLYQPDVQKYRWESWNQDFNYGKSKFILSVRFSDFTDALYWTFYNDIASQIMDKTADQLKEYKMTQQNSEYSDAFLRQQYRNYKVLMRAKINTNPLGHTKLSYYAVKVMPYDFKSENASLLDRLEMYSKKKDLPTLEEMMMFDVNQEANYYGNGGINSFMKNGYSRFG